MVDEKTYLQNGSVKVTSTRVIIGGTTYALGNITSVSIGEQSASILPPFVALTIGVIFAAFVGGTLGNILAIASVIGAIYLFFTRKPS